MYNKVSLASLVVSCAWVAKAAENAKPNSAKTIVGDASFNMRYVEADEQVEFIITMKQSDAWVGLVFGGSPSTMNEGDDMVVFFANGANSSF